MEKIPWWYTEISEAERTKVLAAFENKRFSMGSVTEEMENQIASTLEVPYVVVTSSGTAAITMALMAIGIGPGDEVIVPDLTWIATAQAASILGARVVLVDCLPNLPLMDPLEVKRKITSRTRAIIPVHLNGRSCQMGELLRIARNAGVALIEDACKAFASRTMRGYLGTFGDMGCFSLGMVSLVSAGYGGVVVTNDKSFYEKLKLIRNHGVPREDKEEYTTSGFNFRFSDILAAIGVAQLARLSEKLAHVRRVYQRYVDGLSPLPNVQVIPVDVAAGEVPLCMEVRSRYRDAIITYLEQHGVEALKFHLPLHFAPYLRNTDDFPNASNFAKEGVILPCGPSQPIENVDCCIELLHEWNAHL